MGARIEGREGQLITTEQSKYGLTEKPKIFQTNNKKDGDANVSYRIDEAGQIMMRFH